MFTPAAPRVDGGGRVDVSSLVTAEADSYEAAAAAYARWLRDGWISLLPGRRRWVLRIEPLRQPPVEGLVGALALDAAVHPHEQTDETVAARRAARLGAVPLDLSPVSTYAARPCEALTRAISGSVARGPALEVTDEAGTLFRLWPLVATETLDAELSDLDVVVADGHHRVAAAMTARAGAGAGTARTLAAVWSSAPHSGAVHRLLVGDVASARRRLEDLGRAVGDPGPLEDVARRIAEASGLVIGLVVDPDVAVPLSVDPPAGRPSGQVPARAGAAARVDQVDPAVVHEWLLPRLGQARAVPIADLEQLRTGVADGGLGLLLRPVPSEIVTRVALAGGSLPPKSTSFRPKPRTGLFARALDPGEAASR